MNNLKALGFFMAFLIAMNGFSEKPVLKFKDHKFKIVQFTDLHCISGADFAVRNDSTFMLMRNVIQQEHPDLVVITGDIVVSGNAAGVWAKVIQPMEDAKVPFAVTFGNHDTETGMTKENILKIVQKSQFNLTFNVDAKVAGVGNCSLPIYSTEGKSMAWVLYLFDSHAYPVNKKEYGSYDWIKFSQIQWYRNQSATYARKEGKTVPALAFFHIPLPEFEYVRNQKTTIGSTVEQVCSPMINSGLFSSFIEKGDVQGIFVGHDHNDDFTGSLANICLGYGRKTGYASAYEEVLKRGARVIELYENEKKFDTHIRTIAGTTLDYTFFGK